MQIQNGGGKTRVYDIQFAGPRNRYTVSGVLVHNCGHGWSYGGGAKKLSWLTGLPLETTQRFIDGMAKKYPTLTRWQLKIRKEAERLGSTINLWGRKMVVEKDRAWTQSVALHGQSGTAEILKDGLIRILERDPRLIKWIVGTVHDALIVDIPEEHLYWAPKEIQDCMETNINGIDFPVEHGKPAHNWYLAGH